VRELRETEVVEWFETHVPSDWQRSVDSMSAEEYVEFQRNWLRTLNERGFGAPGVPEKWGGGGYSLRDQATIFAAGARVSAPPTDAFEVSLNHVPATLLTAGTPAQQERYVRGAIDGTVWCQGFSEPGAGSDLAALAARAVRDGDGWRITGQKTWSSHAAHAEHCLLLARTDPNARRHAGITYFILDMDQPGVQVRPIRQIHGPAEFCELFLDGAWVPDENVIGEVNGGWAVAQATLAAERGPIALPTIERIGAELADLASGLGPVEPADGPRPPLSRAQTDLAALLARQIAVRSLALDTVDLSERGSDGGQLNSVLKVGWSELLQEATSAAVLLAGERALAESDSEHFLGYVSGRPGSDWLGSWAATIAGGANEIQLNIIAERLLGLPRDPSRQPGGSR
ncbi:acyl-CoA dehydrogenase, partial [Georgenia ruanii]|nr:acyl-CoA dehydrogenase [Georgenia ruanii]